MTRLTIFGASGRLGRLLVEQALGAGAAVTAFARDPSRLGIVHERLSTVKGDVTDAVAVDEAIRGADAVLSALNTNTKQARPLTRGTRNILEAMARHGVRRLVMSASVPGNEDPLDRRDFRFAVKCGLVKRLVGGLLPEAYADLVESVSLVRASDADWTLVRLFPADGKAKGGVRAGYIGDGMGTSVRRSDAAAFMLDEARVGRFVRKNIVIGY